MKKRMSIFRQNADDRLRPARIHGTAAAATEGNLFPAARFVRSGTRDSSRNWSLLSQAFEIKSSSQPGGITIGTSAEWPDLLPAAAERSLGPSALSVRMRPEASSSPSYTQRWAIIDPTQVPIKRFRFGSNPRAIIILAVPPPGMPPWPSPTIQRSPRCQRRLAPLLGRLGLTPC